MSTPAAPRQRQRGVAAVTAILTVAIATMIATDLLWRSHLDQRRAQSALAAEQSWLYLRGAEVLAAEVLAVAEVEPNHHLGQLWAQPMEGLALDGGTLSGQLEDMQGLFNLNNLIDATGVVDEQAVVWFQRLLVTLELNPDLAYYVADWIDADTQPLFPVGAEDDVYTGREPPYRPPNLPITSDSELLAVEGFDDEVYRELAPFVTALPVGTRLNVNTAPAPVLASLSEELGVGEAEALIEQRAEEGFPDYHAVFAPWLAPEMIERIDERSAFFRLTAIVELGDHRWTLYSLLRREENGAIRAIWRGSGAP